MNELTFLFHVPFPLIHRKPGGYFTSEQVEEFIEDLRCVMDDKKTANEERDTCRAHQTAGAVAGDFKQRRTV